MGQLLVQRGLLTEAALALGPRGAGPDGPDPRAATDRRLARQGDRPGGHLGQPARACRSSTSATTRSTGRRRAGHRQPVAPLSGPADRLGRRPPGRRHGRPLQRLRHRRHPAPHRPEVQAVVATRASIQAAIDKYHRLDTDAENISAQAAEHRRGRRGPLQPSARSSRTRPSSSWSTSSSPRRSPTGPRTSTSSRPSTTCASGTASTASCTR